MVSLVATFVVYGTLQRFDKKLTSNQNNWLLVIYFNSFEPTELLLFLLARWMH